MPRFGVAQGTHEDGSIKIRAVDHMSWSACGAQKRRRTKNEIKADSVNGSCTIPGQMKHDHLDKLLELLKCCKQGIGEVPALWQADIKSAFRRVPLLGEHMWAAGACCGAFPHCARLAALRGVVYLHEGEPTCAFHKGMPFGATSSVWAWHRVGALLSHVARKVLFLPVLRYVDDYFSCERCSIHR